MSKGRPPAARQDEALVFDPRAPSPLIGRGVDRVQQLATVAGSVPEGAERDDGPVLLWAFGPVEGLWGWDSMFVATGDSAYVGPGGKRTSLYGKTRKEVSTKLTDVLSKQQQGLPVALKRQTVGQFLDRWLEDVVKPNIRPKTYHSYAQLVRLHLAPELGKHQLAKLAPRHIQTFMNAKLAAGLSPRTVQYLRAVLRRALGQALKWGDVARNVATLVDPPRSNRPEINPLTPEQARAFLDAAKGDRVEALYSVALALGLRQGEALGLRWEDVDFAAGTISVRYALQRIDKRPLLVEPKTKKSRRTIAMPPSVATALRAHQRRQEEGRLLAGGRCQDWGLVFTSTIGTPLDGSNVTHRLQTLLADAGLPRQRFHDLRHCCASLLLAQHVPPRVVMEILGHSQISLTMDTYSHVIPAIQREAADRMETILTAVAG